MILVAAVGALVVALAVLWVHYRLAAQVYRDQAESAQAKLEYEDIMADLLDDVGRIEPGVAEMAELNRERLRALRPTLERLAVGKAPTFRQAIAAAITSKSVNRRMAPPMPPSDVDFD